MVILIRLCGMGKCLKTEEVQILYPFKRMVSVGYRKTIGQ